MATTTTATVATPSQPQTTVEPTGGPFIRHSEPGKARIYDLTTQAYAALINQPLTAIPGYAKCFRLRIAASGGVNAISTTVQGTADSPESSVALITLWDALGTPIVSGPGFEILRLIQLRDGRPQAAVVVQRDEALGCVRAFGRVRSHSGDRRPGRGAAEQVHDADTDGKGSDRTCGHSDPRATTRQLRHFQGANGRCRGAAEFSSHFQAERFVRRQREAMLTARALHDRTGRRIGTVDRTTALAAHHQERSSEADDPPRMGRAFGHWRADTTVTGV